MLPNFTQRHGQGADVRTCTLTVRFHQEASQERDVLRSTEDATTDEAARTLVFPDPCGVMTGLS